MKHFNSYSELLHEKMRNPDRFEDILYYEGFFCVTLDKTTRKYWFFDISTDCDTDAHREVDLVAALSPTNDAIASGEEMTSLFNSTCCGEHINAGGTASYLWFR